MDLLKRIGASRALTPALLVLAVGGGVLISLGASDDEGAAAGGDSAAEAHAAAGVVLGDSAVSVAFNARAVELETRLHVEPSDAAAALELARLYDDGHRASEAVPLYTRVIELTPDDPQPYYDLASLHAAAAEWDRARAVLEKRLARSPDDAMAMYDLGAVEANAGSTGKAIHWWTQARTATSDPTLRGQIDDALGRITSQMAGPAASGR